MAIRYGNRLGATEETGTTGWTPDPLGTAGANSETDETIDLLRQPVAQVRVLPGRSIAAGRFRRSSLTAGEVPDPAVTSGVLEFPSIQTTDVAFPRRKERLKVLVPGLVLPLPLKSG